MWLRGRAEAKATESGQRSWLSIEGEAERDFPVNATHQIAVKVAVPAGSPAGKFSFRLDVVSAQNPDEDFAEGPNVSFEVGAPPKKKAFPWWLVAAAAVLLVAGLTGYFLFRGRGQEQVMVPNVVGMKLEEASSTLAGNKLKAGQPATRLTEGAATGTVLSQKPAGGNKVSSGAEVQLETAEAAVKVPDLVGNPRQEAETKIQNAGLRVGGTFLQ